MDGSEKESLSLYLLQRSLEQMNPWYLAFGKSRALTDKLDFDCQHRESSIFDHYHDFVLLPVVIVERKPIGMHYPETPRRKEYNSM